LEKTDVNLRSSIVSFACILALAACGGGAGRETDATPRVGGKIVIGDQHVNWGDVTERNSAAQDGLRHLISATTSTSTKHFNNLTYEEYVREAARRKESVMVLKQMLGEHADKAQDGTLRSCTYRAAELGRCTGWQFLRLEQRVALAREVLEKDGRCRWVGFDPAFNAEKSRMAGAGQATVHVHADCR
jgi:hypothetical protein